MPLFVNMTEIDSRINKRLDEKIRVERTILREGIENNKAELERLRDDIFYEVKMLKEDAKEVDRRMEESYDAFSETARPVSENIQELERKLEEYEKKAQDLEQRLEQVENMVLEMSDQKQEPEDIYQYVKDSMEDNNAKLLGRIQTNMQNEIGKNNTWLRQWLDEQLEEQQEKMEQQPKAANVNITLLMHEIQGAVERNIKEQIGELISESAEAKKLKRLEEELNEQKRRQEELIRSNEDEKIARESTRSARAGRTVGMAGIVGIKEKVEEDKEEKREEAQKEPQITPVFCEDATHNKYALEQFVLQCTKLKDSYEAQLGKKDGSMQYFEIVESCRSLFEALLRGMQEKKLSPAQLASQTVKILRQTLIQSLSQKTVKSMVEVFLWNCSVRKIDWQEGRRLSAQDGDYMDGRHLTYQKTNDIRIDKCIAKIERDAYAIDFEQEGEMYEVIIPGVYKVWKYGK